MGNSRPELSDQVKELMNQRDIHENWERTYRTTENEAFFELAYDDLVKRLGQREGSLALDIGCGICANSIRLARRGYIVSAADYSESIIESAKENVARNELENRITIERQDILALSFPSDQFDLVLCWGVLMHIPEAGRALAELARVTKPGGFLVFEEINQNAPGARLMDLLWGLLKRKKITIAKTPAGSEHSCIFEGKTLFWRHQNTRWLVDQLAGHSCELVERKPSMFSESYQYMPTRFLKSSVYAWNRFWLLHVKLPHPASHNIFIFRKKGA